MTSAVVGTASRAVSIGPSGAEGSGEFAMIVSFRADRLSPSGFPQCAGRNAFRDYAQGGPNGSALPGRPSGVDCLALGVLLDLSEVDQHAGLIADHLGVVARRDRHDLARRDLLLGAVVHRDAHPAAEAVSEV